jgi:cobalt-zinc-cadmium efflux system protein
MHRHDHSTSHDLAMRSKLVAATAITVAFAAVELGAGLFADSLALIGDAFHNVTDAFSLVLALIAIVLQRRRPTQSKSYGYQRAGIIASFVNAALLLGFTAFIFVEAAQRFREPRTVDTGIMLWVSLIALAVNLGIAIWLHDRGRADLNVRGAILHQLADALASLGVLVAALLIRLTGNPLFDPLLSTLIGCLILWSAWGILSESLNLMLDGTPRGIDPASVAASIAAEEGVLGVHHLHIWALGPASPALSCHLLLADLPLSSAQAVVGRVGAMLLERHGIVHTTIQTEFAGCATEPPECSPRCDDPAT